MLTALSIRDVVLIERLDLTFEPGLCALTGETGAGKSILLDALGLGLGARGDSGLVRPGAERASVTAMFDVPAGHAVLAWLREQDIPVEDDLVLRRVIGADGRSRAFVNDQAVPVATLKRVGDALIEIQGQFEQRGLLDPATHRDHLDGFGGIEPGRAAVAAAWRAWCAAVAARDEAAAAVANAARDEAFLSAAVAELDELEPRVGEEAELAEARRFLMSRERLTEALDAAVAELSAGRGVDGALRSAQRQLERVAELAGGQLDDALAALDRAAIEAEEAMNELGAVGGRLEGEEGRLAPIDERLFALRDLARKHRVEADALPALHADLRVRLEAIQGGGERLERLERQAAAARAAYVEAATVLSGARGEAAVRLDAAVEAELPPLKLDKARFRTRLDPLDEAAWGEGGAERVRFEVSTNPGAPFGPLGRIASGGELARFMLALKVVLARVQPVATLIFDEVDSGIGGAVADAVGERLARLALGVQVLVVTHSPQVAARSGRHLRVAKSAGAGGAVATRVETLSAADRREEIARMLSGAHITAEARAAADRLLAEAEARGAEGA